MIMGGDGLYGLYKGRRAGLVRAGRQAEGDPSGPDLAMTLQGQAALTISGHTHVWIRNIHCTQPASL